MSKAAPQRPKDEHPAHGMNFCDLMAVITASREQTKNFERIMDKFERMIDKFVRMLVATAALAGMISGLLVLAPSPYAKAVGGTGFATLSVLSIAAWRRIRKWRKRARPGEKRGKSSRSRR